MEEDYLGSGGRRGDTPRGMGGAGSGQLPLCQPDPAPSIPRWLNTLGLLASQGIDVVVRHSFLDHGHNHLVDQNFNPLPVGLPGGIALALASHRSFWGDSLLVACLNSA